MHAIIRALEANTAAVRAVTAAVKELAREVRGTNEQALKGVIKKLDRAGDELDKAVAKNQPDA